MDFQGRVTLYLPLKIHFQGQVTPHPPLKMNFHRPLETGF